MGSWNTFLSVTLILRLPKNIGTEGKEFHLWVSPRHRLYKFNHSSTGSSLHSFSLHTTQRVSLSSLPKFRTSPGDWCSLYLVDHPPSSIYLVGVRRGTEVHFTRRVIFRSSRIHEGIHFPLSQDSPGLFRRTGTPTFLVRRYLPSEVPTPLTDPDVWRLHNGCAVRPN